MDASTPQTPYKSLHNSRRRGRPRKPRLSCAAPGCEQRAYADNPYCPVHTRRYERRGDPTIVLARGRKRGSR